MDKQPEESFYDKDPKVYKVKFKNSDVEFDIETNQQGFAESTLITFMEQVDGPDFEDQVRRLDAIIDDVKGTKTE